MKHILLTAAALAALSACTVNKTDENNVDATATGASANTGAVETLPADDSAGAPADTGNASGSASGNSVTPAPTAASIPAQYQGRWGMVPLDCTGDPSAAKGLIAIDSKSIKFYESRATLKEQRPAIATSFSGLFGFSGEGQTWTKVVTLTRTGDKLKRADDEGSYNYTRCA